jgi:glutamyl-tRNA reductase
MTKRQPLSPEAKAAARALIDQHIRSFCEDMEQRKAERDADELAEQVGRLADELGANV